MAIESKLQKASGERTSIEYTELLLELMTKRFQLLDALAAVSRSQTEAANNPDVTVLLGILARKQVLLEELEEIRRRLAPYHQDDPEQRSWKSAEAHRQCRLIADQGNRLLATLLSSDQATLQEVSRRRDAVASQLQDGTDSVIARTAYTADSVFDTSELDIHEV